ncbi:TadE/TadG family type IV pilus assembly protein [Luteitalea pratensis]|uniref:TadE/TadG family type IV pilus assembly protein n=1 Tax=Luteitalea pratensis TaxID=1855912 RepID=UPI001F202FAF|nr:TadE/TadG family type IV pilus assembly protein [Luteitalea pratensis]
MNRTRNGERGAELVEFAFVLPVLLLVFAGIVDFGFLFQRYEVVTNAAREGARLATLPNYTQADVIARVNDYLNTGIGAGADANATTTMVNTTVAVSGGPGVSARRVEVAYTSTYLVLGPISALVGGSNGFSTITLHGVSTMRVEAPGP